MCWTVAVLSVFGILLSSVVTILSFRYCLCSTSTVCYISVELQKPFAVTQVLLFFSTVITVHYHHHTVSGWHLSAIIVLIPWSHFSYSMHCQTVDFLRSLLSKSMPVMSVLFNHRSYQSFCFHITLCVMPHRYFCYPYNSQQFFFHSNVVCPTVIHPSVILNLFFVIVKPLVYTVPVKFYYVCLVI